MNNERRALYFKFRYVYLSHVLGLWIPVTKILPLTNDEDYHKRHFWVKKKDKKTGKILIFVAHYWNDNWSNLDTWEDLHNEVTHFKEIKRPKP